MCSSNASNVIVDIHKPHHRDARPPGLLWRPTDCAMKHFSEEAACRLLTLVGGMAIFGDSISRHVYQAILNVLSGDYAQGGKQQQRLPPQYSPDANGTLVLRKEGFDPAECRWARQFEGQGCRGVRDLDVDPIAGCRSAKVRFKEDRHEEPFMNSLLSPKEEKAILQVLPPSKATDTDDGVLVVGMGLHDGYNTTSMIRMMLVLLTKLHDWKRDQMRVVLAVPPAAGERKPREYLLSQGNAVQNRFVREMRLFCMQNNITLVDPYKLSRGAHSFDGTHYSQDYNVIFSHVLLNVLETLQTSGLQSLNLGEKRNTTSF